MAGYGNRTGPDYSPDNYTDEHENTRLGITHSNAYHNPHKHGSGTTAGAGFGNKRGSFSKSDSNSSTDEEFRFGLHKDTSPYSNPTPHGSGSTGGAGFGNKTGSFSESHDSTVGKVMEKVGHVLHKENMVEKGHAKRVEKGFGEGEGSV